MDSSENIHTDVFRVNPHVLIKSIEEKLREESIELPKNIQFLKTGHGRQYTPENSEWYYTRMASIVRIAMCSKYIKFSKLLSRYGNRKNRGVRPSKFAKASKFLLSSALKSLTKIGWFNFSNKETVLTEKAKEILRPLIASAE